MNNIYILVYYYYYYYTYYSIVCVYIYTHYLWLFKLLFEVCFLTRDLYRTYGICVLYNVYLTECICI